MQDFLIQGNLNIIVLIIRTAVWFAKVLLSLKMETGKTMKNDAAEAELDITCSSGVADSPGLPTPKKGHQKRFSIILSP